MVVTWKKRNHLAVEVSGKADQIWELQKADGNEETRVFTSKRSVGSLQVGRQCGKKSSRTRVE